MSCRRECGAPVSGPLTFLGVDPGQGWDWELAPDSGWEVEVREMAPDRVEAEAARAGGSALRVGRQCETCSARS
jgi:hypothetical protein